jgi:beta-glucanase (GH16 family)
VASAAAEAVRLPATGAWRLGFAGPAGTTVPAGIFTARTGGNGWGNHELQSYTARAANAALDGQGHLVLHARRQHYIGADGYARDWTSARLDTLGTWSFRTGTLAVRMRGPNAPGTWPAFWLLGANLPRVGWPRCGEVDVVELVGRRGLAFQNVHGPDSAGRPYAASPTSASPRRRLADAAGWHVYSVTRTARSLTFRIDGRVSGTLTPARLAPGQQWVYDRAMFLTLNLAIGGWPGPPTRATPNDARLAVDWIAYRPT